MHTEVFNNIDTLIDMAGSTLNIDEINTDLLTLRKEIKNKKADIEELNSLISDARYFNASNELVDKNIEISLKNKISRLNKKLKDIKASINSISIDENKLHEDIVQLKEKLLNNEQYLEVLTKKVETSKNNNYYKELLKKERDNVNSLNKELKEKEKEYQNILKELDLNNQALEELNNSLDTEKNRLNDILDNLKNPNAYIDEELKNSDQEKLKRLEEEIDDLERKELLLLTDAKVIGTDAKELIANNDLSEALNKIRELVTIVKNRPYMDITNKSILEEELEKKESKRVELSNLIDTKNYEAINSNAINKRLEYIAYEIENNKKGISNYENEINLIDNFINNTLGNIITNLEKEVLELEELIKEYKGLLKNKTSLKAKSNIENALNKKEKEKKILDNLLKKYKYNFIEKLNETNILNDIIQKLEKENNDYINEEKELQKSLLLNFKTKDIIEEEKDKEELKKLNEDIKQIKTRNKYEKSVDELYDEIEMSLQITKTSDRFSEEKNNQQKIELDNLFETSNSEDPLKGRLKVIEMIPVETIQKSDGGN